MVFGTGGKSTSFGSGGGSAKQTSFGPSKNVISVNVNSASGSAPGPFEVNREGLKGEQDKILKEAFPGISWPATSFGKENGGNRNTNLSGTNGITSDGRVLNLIQNDLSFDFDIRCRSNQSDQ